MSTLRALYHLARADFLERVRRHSFLIVLGLTIYAGYSLVPPRQAGYVAGALICLMPETGRDCVQTMRGVYNSAWVGSMVALVSTFFLSLLGFYLVKNAVERDRQTRVGQIIATTPLSKLLYTLGKWLSNFAVLTVMVGTLFVAALAMQLIRGEELRIELWALLSPFLLIALPMMSLIAALAVLFESIGVLRGGVGNAVYFFLWSGFIPIGMTWSLSAWVLIGDNVEQSILTAFPGFRVGGSWGVNPVEGNLQLFRWEGLQWTSEMILERLAWVGVALIIALAASIFFNRFDSARGLTLHIAPRRKSARPTAMSPSEVGAAAHKTAPVSLTPLTPAPVRPRFGRTLLAELRLMLKRRRWWWYTVALGLSVSCLFAPLDVSRPYLLPVAWLWPLLTWSLMGVREIRHHTEQFVFSTAHPLRCQLPATWLAGVIVTALTGGGVAVRLILAGEWMAVSAWLIGVLFIPSLALALGTWSGSSKLFEVVYVILWYVGPINQIPALDFMGVLDKTIAAGVPLYYLGITIVLLALAVAGRWRQLRN